MQIPVRQSSIGAAPQAMPARDGRSLPTRGGVLLWLPLPFLLTGALAAVDFGALLPLLAPTALQAPDFPQVLALVHIATLGWLTMIIMGASLQLTAVILIDPLRATRLARAQYPVYTLGVALLVAGFWTSHLLLPIVGGSLVVLAVAHYAVILGTTLTRASTRPLTARYLAAAVSYLCLVVGLGLTAALNLQLGFLGDGADRLVRAHVTLGVVGWLTCLLMGVSYTLVPMFALVPNHAERLGRHIFLLLNGGVLGLALGFGLAWRPVAVLAGLVLVGAVEFFVWDYHRMLRARRRKPLDVTQRHGIAAVAYLALVIPAGVLAALEGLDRPPVLFALGLAALVGWLGQSTIGYLYKIVPFLIWQVRYAPLVGRQPVPLLRDLVHQRLALASFWLINLALPMTIFAGLLGWSVPLQVVAAVLGVGLALASGNVVGALVPWNARR